MIATMASPSLSCASTAKRCCAPMHVRMRPTLKAHPARNYQGCFSARQYDNKRVQAVSQAAAGPDADLVEVELKVGGMVCENCSSRVQKALQDLDIVKSASVSHESGLASLQVDAPSLYDAFNELPGLINAVTEQGFTAEPHFEDAPADE